MFTIIIGKKTQKSGYFEIEYTFNLETPKTTLDAKAKEVSVGTQVASDNSITTITGVASYSDEMTLSDIKKDLLARYIAEQDNLYNDQSLIYAGLAFDGATWA